MAEYCIFASYCQHFLDGYTMFTLAIILMIILGLLLIAAVLIQPGKGDMTTSMSGFGNQLGTMFGSRRASDLLTKITIIVPPSTPVQKPAAPQPAPAQQQPATEQPKP